MNYLIEGIKLAGKSTLAQNIISADREYSLFSLKNYFEHNVSKNESHFESHYRMNKDLNKILYAYVNFLKQVRKYKFILIRGHIFPFAYAKATNQEINLEFEQIDNLFYELDIKLIFLKINESEFYRRLEDRISSGRIVRKRDLNWTYHTRIQEAYEYYFSKSILKKAFNYGE